MGSREPGEPLCIRPWTGTPILVHRSAHVKLTLNPQYELQQLHPLNHVILPLILTCIYPIQ